MRLRTICYLNNLGTMPLTARKKLWNKNYTPFPYNIILLKEKGGMKESILRQVDKKSRGPQGERGLEFSRRRKGQASFFLYIP